jgi:hypothetical protein
MTTEERTHIRRVGSEEENIDLFPKSQIGKPHVVVIPLNLGETLLGVVDAYKSGKTRITYIEQEGQRYRILDEEMLINHGVGRLPHPCLPSLKKFTTRLDVIPYRVYRHGEPEKVEIGWEEG